MYIKYNIKLKMKLKTEKLFALAAVIAANLSYGALRSYASEPGDKNSRSSYSNPVCARSLADPTVIQAEDGTFYLYATAHNVSIMKSSNLVDWEAAGTAFTNETRPDFVPKAGIWAPDINKIGDKYVMYYAMSVWGGEWDCGIGCAVADSPAGPFTDCGKMFNSKEIGVRNSIDPFYIEDGGRKYLFWGSFHEIFWVELSGDGLSVKAGCKPVQVAGNAFEGVYILKKGGKYYMFASVGSCCAGASSTYTTVVGRSDSLFGPYTDKAGRPMLQNHYEVLIHGNEVFAGTGHNAEIVTDDSGKDWILYHAFDRSAVEVGRMLLLDRVMWKKSWPYVKDAQPSSDADAPVFLPARH